MALETCLSLNMKEKLITSIQKRVAVQMYYSNQEIMKFYTF